MFKLLLTWLVIMCVGFGSVASANANKRPLVIALDMSTSISHEAALFKNLTLQMLDDTRVREIIVSCFSRISLVPWSSGSATEWDTEEIVGEQSIVAIRERFDMYWPINSVGNGQTHPSSALSLIHQRYSVERPVTMVLIDDDYFTDLGLLLMKQRLSDAGGTTFAVAESTVNITHFERLMDLPVVIANPEDRFLEGVRNALVIACEAAAV